LRLDELRLRSAESALAEAAALERHAPAAERDARATRELAEAAGDLAAVPLGGFTQGGSPTVASAGGSPGASPGPSIGTGAGSGASEGFTRGPSFLSSQSGFGREGGRILAEEWIADHCRQTSFEVPNPQNSQALAQKDFVQVPGWDCSSEFGVPPGTVVYYDPEAWEELQGVARLSKTSSGGTINPSLGASQRRDAGRGLVNQNLGRSAGSAGGTGGQPTSVNTSQVIASDPKAVSLLGKMVTAQEATLAELRKRPVGPSGSKGQRLI
jgi:hypothetical protein